MKITTNKSVANPEYYNLLMPDGRPGSPYPQLEKYNTSLTKTGVGTDYPVEVMRHHIIPDSQLKKFWNQMVERGQLVDAIDGFLHAIYNNVDGYSINLIPADRNAVKLLTDKIRYKQYLHDPNKPHPDGIDNLAAVYEWLPGNLFIGPKGGGGQYQRTDDPGDGFEKNSNIIIGSTAYDNLKKADSDMAAYLSQGDLKKAQNASIYLIQAAKTKSPKPISSNNWLFKQKKYRIKTI